MCYKICSAHFQLIIKKDNHFKHLHNKVNAKLKKPIFDCKKAFGFWGECGCSKKINFKEIRKDCNKGVKIDIKKEINVKKEEVKF